MKRILISLSIIGAAAAIAIGATTAFFSDTETSQGNTFTAGAIDLQIDSHATFNGVAVPNSTWALKDLVPTSDKFFNLTDIKPGDVGEDTISLHVINNDAWVCAQVSNLTNLENGRTEPEAAVDTSAGTNEGELQNALVMTIWRDDGVGSNHEGKCDNIHQDGEATLASGHPVNGVLPIYDSHTGTGALPGGSTSCLGVAWSLPIATGNEVQTDSMTGDISFNVVQSRNNGNFVCGVDRPVVEIRHISLENKDASWNILANDNIYGLIQYSHNDTTFHGVVSGTGLVASGLYQITLNGPKDGANAGCSFTNQSLGNFAGGNTFKGGFWDSAAPNLSATCHPGSDEEGLYNMNLIGDHYTFIADASGAFNYPFSFSLPAGDYHDVKVLVKKMLPNHGSPWSDTGTGYPMFNLYETASIDFTILP